MQLGKNGVTEKFIGTLKGHFKNRDMVKLSILKSATRDREELKKITDEILDGLGKNYTAKRLGFTLFVKKWRKDKR